MLSFFTVIAIGFNRVNKLFLRLFDKRLFVLNDVLIVVKSTAGYVCGKDLICDRNVSLAPVAFALGSKALMVGEILGSYCLSPSTTNTHQCFHMVS